MKIAAAVVLVVAYGVLRAGRRSATAARTEDEDELDAAVLRPRLQGRSARRVAVRRCSCSVSLAAIIAGAELFVNGVEDDRQSLGIATLVLALVLAPLATELPEKANSVLWVRAGKDSLALGNVTGAMVFQSHDPDGLRHARHAVGSSTATRSRPRAWGWLGGAVALWTLRGQRFGLAPCPPGSAFAAGVASRRSLGARAHGMNSGPLSVKAVRNSRVAP